MGPGYNTWSRRPAVLIHSKSEINEIDGFSGTKVERQTEHDTAGSSPNDGMLTSQPHFPSAEFSAHAVQQNKTTGECKR
jgi:hypothetical protein